MIHIAIFQRDLHLGGVQKSLLNLLNAVDLKKYSIDLFVVDDENFFEKSVPQGVNVIKIESLPFYTKLLPFSLVKLLYSSRYPIDKEYDVAIDYDGYQHLTAMLAACVRAERRIMWFHGNHHDRKRTDWRYLLAWNLQKGKYRYFDRAVVVSRGLKPLVEQDTPFNFENIYVMNNYVDTHEIDSLSNKSVSSSFDQHMYNLVSVCRLEREKGVDQTIRIVADVLQQRVDMMLYIIGDGSYKARLIELARTLEVSDKIVFVGAQKNPYALMKLADGYVATPRSEGQGISTVEAAYLGLDIFIPQRLEEFIGITVHGRLDIKDALMRAEKRSKQIYSLNTYNRQVVDSFDNVVEG